MKKVLTGLCAIALCFGLVLPVRLQAAQVPDAVANAKDVDYDVTVASNDNELNLRVGPGAEYPLAYSTPHHNGDVLHIYKETTAASGNPWGFTLGGPNRDVPGWIALIPTNRAGAAPAPQAAAPAAPAQASGSQTSSQPAAYSGSGTAADYDVMVNSADGELNLRTGPGAEYPLAYSTPHRNGDVLHITKTATAASGNPWGYTMGGPNRDIPGWVALNLTSRTGSGAQTGAGSAAGAGSSASSATSAQEAASNSGATPASSAASASSIPDVGTAPASSASSSSASSAASATPVSSASTAANADASGTGESAAAASVSSASEAAASVVPVQSAEEVEKEGKNYVLTRAVAGVGTVGGALLLLRWLQVRNYRKRYQNRRRR